MEVTMADKKPDPDKIAEEAVGEALESRHPEAGKEEARPVTTSVGPQANVADKTAESVGERAGDAYADATPDEARERSRNAVRHAATQGRAQAGSGGLSGQFDQRTFSVFAAFALGYAAALLIHRRSQ
jgi:hypothetical protein